MSKISKTHVENALNKVRKLFEEAESKIENLKLDEKIAATRLADDLAAKNGLKGPGTYQLLKFLFDDYPGVEISVGRYGGIKKVKVFNDSSPDVVNDDTNIQPIIANTTEEK